MSDMSDCEILCELIDSPNSLSQIHLAFPSAYHQYEQLDPVAWCSIPMVAKAS